MRQDLQIVCIPSRDRAFAGDALELADRIPPELDPPEARAWYESALRRAHPHASVRERTDAPGASAEVRLWYVTRRDHPFRIDAAVRVPLPPDEAFAVYVDRVTEWQSALVLERVDTSPGLVGREYLATYHAMGLPYAGHVRMVAAAPPVEAAYEAEGSGITVWYVTRFTGQNAGTDVRVQGDYALPSSLLTRVADLFGLERAIARDIDRAHESYRSLCVRLVRDAADGPEPGAEAPPSWTDAVERLRLAQLRYREVVDGPPDPIALGEAQEELLDARGEVDQLRRDLELPEAGRGPEG